MSYFFTFQSTGLKMMFKESSSNVPLIFILSSGTDPASALYSFAEESGMQKKLTAVSLGQGQVHVINDISYWNKRILHYISKMYL